MIFFNNFSLTMILYSYSLFLFISTLFLTNKKKEKYYIIKTVAKLLCLLTPIKLFICFLLFLMLYKYMILIETTRHDMGNITHLLFIGNSNTRISQLF